MEVEKKVGKRGRPRKIITEPIEPVIKRKRGRPSKTISGENNIKMKKSSVDKEVDDTEEEVYTPPTILRKKRVFRFDKKVFHDFVKRYNGDILVMSYVIDQLMKLYNDDKIKVLSDKNAYYYKWVLFNPPLEPLEENDISSSNALMKGIPLQYRYPILINEDLYIIFEKKCDKSGLFFPYVMNELVKILLDEKNKINIDITKYREWCIL